MEESKKEEWSICDSTQYADLLEAKRLKLSRECSDTLVVETILSEEYESLLLNHLLDSDIQCLSLEEFPPSPEHSLILKQIKSTQSYSSICGRTINQNQILYACDDCSLHGDISCYCVSCFNHNKHQGHNYYYQIGLGGVCDCGDPSLLKREGWCDHHSKQIQPPSLPHQVCDRVHYVLRLVFHDLARVLAQNKPNYDPKIIQYVQWTIAFLRKLAQINFILVPLLLRYFYYAPVLWIKRHRRRCVKQWCGEDDIFWQPEQPTDLGPFSEESQISKQQNLCHCRVLDLLLIYINSGEESYELVDFFSEMAKIDEQFRKNLLISFFLHYDLMNIASKNRERQIQIHNRILCQVLLSQELGLHLMQNQKCLKNLLKEFKKAMTIFLGNSTMGIYDGAPFNINFDFGIIIRNNISEHMIEKTNFVEKYLEIFEKNLDFKFIICRRETHIIHAEDGINIIFLVYCYNYLEVWQKFLNRYDFHKDHLNQKLGRILVAHISRLNTKGGKIIDSGTYYLSIFSYRLLSAFLNKLILTKYLESWIHDSDLQLLQRKIEDYLKDILGMNSEELDNWIENTFRIVMRVITLICEIRGNKWVYYGEQIKKFQELYLTDVNMSYCALDLNLLFCLTLAYSKPHELLNMLIEHMETQDIFQNPTDEGEWKEYDAKKSQLEFESFMFMMISLISNEFVLLSTFLRMNWDKYSHEKYNINIIPIAHHLIKKKAVYNFILNGANIGIQKLVDLSPFYLRLKDLKGVIQSCFFCPDRNKLLLKPESFQYFDSFESLDQQELFKIEVETLNSLQKITSKIDFYAFQTLTKNHMILNLHILFIKKLIHSRFPHYLTSILVSKNEILSNDSIKILCLKMIWEIIMIYDKFSEEEKEIIKKELDKWEKIKIMIEKISENNKFYTSSLELLNKKISKIMGKECDEEEEKKEERKKPNYKDMQKNIMAEFSGMRAKFEEKKKEEIKRPEAEESKEWEENDSSSDCMCSYCKEPLNSVSFEEQPYGKLSTLDRTNILSHGFNQTIQRIKQKHVSPIDLTDKQEEPNVLIGENLIINTCNHFMHFHCLTKFTANSSTLHFCPICKSLFTFIIPSIPSSLHSFPSHILRPYTKLFFTQLKGKNVETSSWFLANIWSLLISNVKEEDNEGVDGSQIDPELGAFEEQKSDITPNIITEWLNLQKTLYQDFGYAAQSSAYEYFQQYEAVLSIILHSIFHSSHFISFRQFHSLQSKNLFIGLLAFLISKQSPEMNFFINSYDNILKSGLLKELSLFSLTTKNIFKEDAFLTLFFITNQSAIFSILLNKFERETWKKSVTDLMGICFQRLILQIAVRKILKDNNWTISWEGFENGENMYLLILQFLQHHKQNILIKAIPFFQKCVRLFCIYEDWNDDFYEELIQLEAKSKLENLNFFLNLFGTMGDVYNSLLNTLKEGEANLKTKMLDEIISGLNLDKNNNLKIPLHILVLNKRLSVNLIELGENYSETILSLYERKCINCKEHRTFNKGMCLLCGEIICFKANCCSQKASSIKLPKRNNISFAKYHSIMNDALIGEATIHAELCGAGNALFLSFLTGKVLVVSAYFSVFRPSMYFNSFKENLSILCTNSATYSQKDFSLFQLNLKHLHKFHQIALQSTHRTVIFNEMLISSQFDKTGQY
jgi:hypothetical protein